MTPPSSVSRIPIMTDDEQGTGAPSGTGSHADAPSPTVSALTGFDPSRVREAVRGAAEMAAYFGTPERETAEDMAWHAGYAAGSTEHAARSAGYTAAERDIMAWLQTRGPIDFGCRSVEHTQGYCSCFDVLKGIQAAAHRDHILKEQKG